MIGRSILHGSGVTGRGVSGGGGRTRKREEGEDESGGGGACDCELSCGSPVY
uniref:Uncharacterized protein n=1 Tax=Arundo donax TaxID=35708 RepID=A0A0A9B480_ARUDO